LILITGKPRRPRPHRCPRAQSVPPLRPQQMIHAQPGRPLIFVAAWWQRDPAGSDMHGRQESTDTGTSRQSVADAQRGQMAGPGTSSRGRQPMVASPWVTTCSRSWPMLSGRCARWWPGSRGISVLTGWWRPHQIASTSSARQDFTSGPGSRRRGRLPDRRQAGARSPAPGAGDRPTRPVNGEAAGDRAHHADRRWPATAPNDRRPPGRRAMIAAAASSQIRGAELMRPSPRRRRCAGPLRPAAALRRRPACRCPQVPAA